MMSMIHQTATQVKSYTCGFCKKGFSNAQALGGHMNIHRRDRAKLRQQSYEDNNDNNNMLSSITNNHKNPNPNNYSDDDELPIFHVVDRIEGKNNSKKKKKELLDLELRLGREPVNNKEAPTLSTRYFF